MHACGHDTHTSVGLGVAEVLASVRERLPGTVKMIFQPAEEGPPEGEEGGAELMREGGVLEDPRPGAIFALHAFPDLEVGKIGWTPGPALAAVDHFYVTILGRQSHGASPDLGVDPVVMASQAVTALQTIRSRNLDPLEPSVVTVGMIHGGERFNIIPDRVRLEGTVRTYDDSVRTRVEQRMREILEGIARAGGGDFELRYDRVTPATVNDPELARRGAGTLARVAGRENVLQVEPVMGGEDFAYFSREVPGFYFRLGTTDPEHGSGGLHTPTFRGDDGAVPVGIRALSHLVVDYLAGEVRP
jgi:amidohydrolase